MLPAQLLKSFNYVSNDYHTSAHCCVCSLRGVTSEGENCLKRDSVQTVWISFPVRDRVYGFVFILFPHRYRKIKWALSQGHRKTICPASVSRGCGLGTDCILWDFGHVLDSFCHSLEPPEKGLSTEVLPRSDWPVIMCVRGWLLVDVGSPVHCG